jgi:hypothetical protein
MTLQNLLEKDYSLKDASKSPPWPIDIVFTWCGLPDVSSCRYTEDLRYSIRSICTNTPWFRKIIIIVQDDFFAPLWMSQNKRIVFVKHSSFIPIEFLPTTNSHVISSWMVRIRCISDHFIYLNDDMYIGTLTPWTCFYTKLGAPINRHFKGGGDHGLYPDHRIPYVRMWVAAIQKYGIHNTRIQQCAQPYTKKLLNKYFKKYETVIRQASRERYVTGEKDFNLLKFTTSITSTTKEAAYIETEPYDCRLIKKGNGVIDYFVEASDKVYIKKILVLRPRFFIVNNSSTIYSHLYDILRIMFPAPSEFELKI